mgnify:CR=1 FL=1
MIGETLREIIWGEGFEQRPVVPEVTRQARTRPLPGSMSALLRQEQRQAEEADIVVPSIPRPEVDVEREQVQADLIAQRIGKVSLDDRTPPPMPDYSHMWQYEAKDGRMKDVIYDYDLTLVGDDGVERETWSAYE